MLFLINDHDVWLVNMVIFWVPFNIIGFDVIAVDLFFMLVMFDWWCYPGVIVVICFLSNIFIGIVLVIIGKTLLNILVDIIYIDLYLWNYAGVIGCSVSFLLLSIDWLLNHNCKDVV